MTASTQHLTLPNKITIGRILLIPLFVLVCIDYIRSCSHGHPQEWERILACAIFALAAVSDAVDGYIARRYHQKSELGTFLDPLADKALLVSALILLSRDNGDAFEQLPLWFPVLVISRDAILLAGTVLIHIVAGHARSQPRIVGKCATFFQMITLGWVLLKIEHPPFNWPMITAGVFTFISGVWYIFDGVKQLNAPATKPA
ncbi:MAG TPA: CDP-diacylglycerol--glycerol-3-phosphate 3-phosphatidyltransferase [Verrucomicrobiae bacterium]|nr:CDP-diacylglycerol--glycerol-3-phosphate 3-phosphatidyltransferase [Verrucomicrobiae bacterium]